MKLKCILPAFLLLTALAAGAQNNPFVWVKDIPFEISAQCTDESDNIYIAGAFRDTILLENYSLVAAALDMILCKYDSSGQLVWYRQFGGPDEDFNTDLECAPNGDLVVTNGFNRNTLYYGDTIVAGANSHGAILMKLSSYGDLIWYNVPVFNNNGCIHIFSSATGPDGEVLLEGNIQWGNAIFTDTILPSYGTIPGFVAYYEPDGSFRWARKVNIYNKRTAIDADGNVIIAQSQIYKLSADSITIWQRIAGISFYETIGGGLDTDSASYISVACRNERPFFVDQDTVACGSDEYFLWVRLDPDGHPVMTKTGSSPFEVRPADVSIRNDRVFITGTFRDRLRFSSDSLVSVTDQLYNSFIVKYDLAGNEISFAMIDGVSGSKATLISASKSIYVSGETLSDTLKLGNLMMLGDPSDYRHYFLARMRDEVYQPLYAQEDLILYPNPVQSALNVVLPSSASGTIVEILSPRGRRIFYSRPEGRQLQIDVSAYPEGVYLLRMISDEHTITKKFVRL